ncbi:hypothetical protein EWM64_g9286 [Hericium alpestre]|uniref:Uncharacterized protein n=1 Tax=Hericium alpestre TaxID=135208 RepID=A0A4Y9ZIV7_9AGAM|nr:hypothetical protein EWM64_g9286 [Hericium alpestre]
MPHDLVAKSDPVVHTYPPVSRSSQKAIDAADISQIFEHGFLFVGDAPLPILLPSNYTAWEDALTRAKALPVKLNDSSRAAEAWRQSVREMPVLSISLLKNDLRLLNLARGVLTFLQHFYIHSLPDARKPPHAVIPASLAVPLLAVSRAVDLPPVMTFADCNFYNFRLGDAKGPEHEKEILVQHTFSQTADEMQFYLSGLLIEREGVRSVRVMSDLVQHFAKDGGARFRRTSYRSCER